MEPGQSNQQSAEAWGELSNCNPRLFCPYAIVEQDRIENGEERWQTIGVVDGIVMLLVAHTVRQQDEIEVIRIISARRADHRERRRYEEENG